MINKIVFVFLVSQGSNCAHEIRKPVVPALNLSGLSAATSMSDLSAAVTNHFQKFSSFYSRIKTCDQTQLAEDALHKSISSTLFRGAEGDDKLVNQFLTIIQDVSQMSAQFTSTQDILLERMNVLTQIWDIMKSSSDQFIAKAILTGAKKISQAKKIGDDELYKSAKNCLNGTILQINTLTGFLNKYGYLIEELLKTQRELLYLALKGQKLTKESDFQLMEILAQDDFAIETLNQALNEQLTKAHLLLGLIPSVQERAQKLLDSLVPAEPVEPKRRRSLTASGSLRNLLTSPRKSTSRDNLDRTKDQETIDIIRATSAETQGSPSTPGRRKSGK